MKRWSLFLFVGLVATGCATAPKSTEPPDRFRVTSEPLPDEELDEAERELHGALFRGDDEERGDAVEGGAPEPLARSETAREQASRCSRACRALGSMDRAAGRLCELTGEGDERCGSARERVAAARQLVVRACAPCPD